MVYRMLAAVAAATLVAVCAFTARKPALAESPPGDENPGSRDAPAGRAPEVLARFRPVVVQHGPVATKTLSLMRSWPRAAIPTADLEGVAESIASAAEPDADPYGAAALLAGLAYFEGARFAAYVDDGSCNRWMRDAPRHEEKFVSPRGHRYGVMVPDRGWIVAHELLRFGNCDGGYAYSLWQIHPFGKVTAAQLADRNEAARVALSIARADESLALYTGEGRSWHPKADERRAFVERALRSGFR